MNDSELDDWLAGLSGRRSSRPNNDESATLRQAILERANRTLTGAQAAGEGDDPQEVERLITYLRQQGALPPVTAAAVPAPGGTREREVRRRIRRVPSRVYALAASVALVAVLGGVFLNMSHSSLDEGAQEGMRGAVGGIRIISAQPRDTAAQVQRELLAMHIASRLVPGDSTTIVQTTVAAGQLADFNAWMVTHGGAARAVGDYRIAIVPP